MSTPATPLLTVLSGLFLVALPCQAVTIASTNFDGRTRTTGTTTNDTATGLIWTTDGGGVQDPGDLTAVPDQALTNGFTNFQNSGLFQTGSTSNSFVPDLNVHNEGSYYVDIPLSISFLGGYYLNSLSFTGIITNNAGNLQGVGREVDFRAEVFDPANNIIASDNVNGQNAFIHNSPPVPTTTVTLEFGGVRLNPGGFSYNLRLYVGADDNFVGNNAGIDDLVIDATPGPEPSSALLALLGGMMICLRRRR